MTRHLAALLLVGLLGACRSPDAASDAGALPPAPGDAAPVAASPSAGDRLVALRTAEARRAVGAVTPADQQSRDVAVRRAAARALARIGGDGARPGLLRGLDDEDDEVVAWSAYGLGFWCKGHEKETVTALVARALALPRVATKSALPPASAAIARAIGACGAEESEPTLVAWLGGLPEQAVAASFALGDLASAKQKLREETLAALLNVAAGSASAPPVPEALYPIGRLSHVPLTVVDRIREVATARLAAQGEARIFAVKALGRAGDGAAAELARVLGTPASFSAPERAEAARSLAHLGPAGQRQLAGAIERLVPPSDPVALTGLVGEDFGVLLTAVHELGEPAPAKKALADIAALAPPPGAPASILRRLSLLRCEAAKALAGSSFQDKTLAACDVSGGGIGARALVEVLGRADITGPRLAAFRERATRGDLRAREAALELLEKHDEIDGAAALLAAALAAKESGLVATAADVLAKQPARAVDARAAAKPGRRKGKKKVDIETVSSPAGPSPAVVKALLDALGRPSAEQDPESAGPLIDAAGALAIADAKPRLEQLCGSPYPTTREHAQKALALLGEKKACEAPADGAPPPAELDHLATAPVAISLETDAGVLRLALDPTLSPVAVTRVVDLVRAGYYDGIVVHRVVTGFVSQFGAPFGDGFGGPEGKAALPCETSPVPFVPLAVGVALAGRDTGSSQLFVMQSRAPHLDGLYALLGTASGPWGALADGDVIRKATVAP